MTPWELGLGWLYFAFQQLFLAQILLLLNALFPTPLNAGKLNFLYFAVNFVAVIGIFHRFLWKSLQAARETSGIFLRTVGESFLIYYAASLLIGALILHIDPDFSNVNDAGIAVMMRRDYKLIAAGSVFLVPVAEETLFRGLLFRGLCRVNRAVAYSVSALVFAAVHVVGYIGLYSPLTLLLCFVQYLPAGLCLGWAYAKTDTIFTPIAIHTVVNVLGILALR